MPLITVSSYGSNLTPEQERVRQIYNTGFIAGRRERIWGFTWRVMMLVLMLEGGRTLFSSFCWFLALAMGSTPSKWGGG